MHFASSNVPEKPTVTRKPRDVDEIKQEFIDALEGLPLDPEPGTEGASLTTRINAHKDSDEVKDVIKKMRAAALGLKVRAAYTLADTSAQATAFVTTNLTFWKVSIQPRKPKATESGEPARQDFLV